MITVVFARSVTNTYSARLPFLYRIGTGPIAAVTAERAATT